MEARIFERLIRKGSNYEIAVCPECGLLIEFLDQCRLHGEVEPKLITEVAEKDFYEKFVVSPEADEEFIGYLSEEGYYEVDYDESIDLFK